MRAFLAFSLAAAILLIPAVASAVSREDCLNYCEVNRSETTDACNSPLAKSNGKKSVRDCFRFRDSAYRNCKGGCMCNPPKNGLPC
jgi:hypothetical protein